MLKILVSEMDRNKLVKQKLNNKLTKYKYIAKQKAPNSWSLIVSNT